FGAGLPAEFLHSVRASPGLRLDLLAMLLERLDPLDQLANLARSLRFVLLGLERSRGHSAFDDEVAGAEAGERLDNSLRKVPSVAEDGASGRRQRREDGDPVLSAETRPAQHGR